MDAYSHTISIILSYVEDWRTLLTLRRVSSLFLKKISSNVFKVNISTFFDLSDVADSDFFWQDSLVYQNDRKKKNKRNSLFSRLFNMFRLISVKSIKIENRVIGRRSFLVLVAAFSLGSLQLTDDMSSIPRARDFHFPDNLTQVSEAKRVLGRGLREVYFENVFFGCEGCACCDVNGNKNTVLYWQQYWKFTNNPELSVYLDGCDSVTGLFELGLPYFCEPIKAFCKVYGDGHQIVFNQNSS